MDHTGTIQQAVTAQNAHVVAQYRDFPVVAQYAKGGCSCGVPGDGAGHAA